MSLTPAARACSVSPTTTPSADVRMRTVSALDASRRPWRRRWARVSSASRHSTRRRSMRTGPVSWTRTVRHSPPGFQWWSTASEHCSIPVMLRRPLVPRSGAHVTSTASTCSSDEGGQPGDVEAVREEVPLRVSEVGAVEPGVALVHDPVERHPPSPSRWRGSLLEVTAVEHRAVAGWRTRGALANARGRRARPTPSRRRRSPCRCGGPRRRPPGHATGQRDPRRPRLGVSMGERGVTPLGSSHDSAARNDRRAEGRRVAVAHGQRGDPRQRRRQAGGRGSS